MSKIIAFLKSRPTETWLGLWAAAVAVLTYFGVVLDQTLTATVSAAIGALITFFAAQPTNTFGPQ